MDNRRTKSMRKELKHDFLCRTYLEDKIVIQTKFEPDMGIYVASVFHELSFEDNSLPDKMYWNNCYLVEEHTTSDMNIALIFHNSLVNEYKTKGLEEVK